MLHYEIHVTVQTKHPEAFTAKCKEIGVKPIILDLQKKSGDVLCEVMTSSTISTDDQTVETALREMYSIENELTKNGFNIVRGKIETVPWHPSAPSEHNGKQHFPGSHFETHFGVVINYPEDAEDLREIAKRFNMHLSKNVFKHRPDGSYIQMATYRSYDKVKEDFELLVNEIAKSVFSHHLVLEKPPKIEFAIYDSNANHDSQWLKS